jgi:pimeloyl-ACP methyl ester carboxylesterase
MNQWTGGKIVSSDTPLHYVRTGGSKPPLVLAHGITDDGLCWSPVANALSGQYDVIMVDCRGHGRSGAPDDGYNQVTMATELAGLIEGLGLGNPFLLGHSMGAATALVLAGLYPDLPRAILLEDPPNFWSPPDTSPQADDRRSSMQSWMVNLKRKTHSELLTECRMANPDWQEAEFLPWVDSKHRFSLKITQLFHQKGESPGELSDLLKKINCPAMLITADPERGAILGEDDVNRLKTFVPHLENVLITGAGHNIRREQFSRYMSVVREYLSGLTG